MLKHYFFVHNIQKTESEMSYNKQIVCQAVDIYVMWC